MSNRIKEIVSEIRYNSMADIGTDHGYISITAALSRYMKKIIASDINSEPLNNCIANVKKNNLDNIIETRLGAGLSKIKENEIETIVIAGMGGNLIIDILQDDLPKVKKSKQLVLSPQSSVPRVRKYLHEIGFGIISEKIVFEDGFYYNIVSAKNGIIEMYSEEEYYFGKLLIESNSPLLAVTAESRLKKLWNLKNNILDKAKTIDENKINKLNDEINILKYFLQTKGITL